MISIRYSPLTRSIAIISILTILHLSLRAQLQNAMDSGAAFAGYEEGPLLFRPTYRYDVGTDIYDTSEKMRIPAWTGMLSSCPQHLEGPEPFIDRILYRGPALDLAVYSRSELVGSDHRPGWSSIAYILLCLFLRKPWIQCLEFIEQKSI